MVLFYFGTFISEIPFPQLSTTFSQSGGAGGNWGVETDNYVLCCVLGRPICVEPFKPETEDLQGSARPYPASEWERERFAFAAAWKPSCLQECLIQKWSRRNYFSSKLPKHLAPPPPHLLITPQTRASGILETLAKNIGLTSRFPTLQANGETHNMLKFSVNVCILEGTRASVTVQSYACLLTSKCQ